MKKLARIVLAFLPLVAGCAAGLTGSARDVPEVVVRIAAGDATVVGLSNGLTVIVRENHNAPVVCVQSAVRAGGLYEGKYLGSGISHLVEHLVAEGAESGGTAQPGKTRSTRIDRIGGQSNAFTSLDDTNFYIAATSSKTDECIDLVADWMARPGFTPADFAREQGVVQREMGMGRDEADRQLRYAHMQNLYGTHPAGARVIGYENLAAALTFQDVLEYHARMYVPQNMVFVVVGDVDTPQVLQRIRRQFSGCRPGRTPDLTLPEVQPVAATRRAVLTSPAITEDQEQLAFLTIPLVHADLYPLDVLSYVLTQGPASRLAQVLKYRQRVVTEITSASWTPHWGKGEFVFDFRCAAGTADTAEQALLAELRKVLDGGVSPPELDRAKRQKLADLVYSQQTVESQAATLASDFLSTGNVDFSRVYTERIGQVTAEQVQAAAKKYFDFDSLVITRMAPVKAKAASAPDFGQLRPAGSRPELVEGSRAATRPSAGLATATPWRAGRALAVTFTLPNGLRVVLQPTQAVGLVSTALVGRGGLLLETDKTNGLGALMTRLSTRGAGERTAEQIAAFFDGAGGGVSTQCGNNTFVWQATVLADSAEEALPVFADIVLRPTFPQEQLDKIRPLQLAGIGQVSEDWGGLLNRMFRQDFFGDTPLGRISLGSPEVVKQATGDQIAKYHADNLKAGSSVLTVYGQFDPQSVRIQVEKLFAAMPPGRVEVPEVPPRKVKPAGENHVHKEAQMTGAGAIVAAPGMKLTDRADVLPMTVLKTVLGGYQLPRGWLHDQLRGKQLVYVVWATNWAALAPGAFLAGAHCEPDKVDEVVKCIRADLEKARTYRFSQEEVDEAVSIILTADLLDKQAVSELALQSGLDELYGFGYDYRDKYEALLRKVAPADLNRVARKYFGSGFVTVIVTGKAGAGEGEK